MNTKQTLKIPQEILKAANKVAHWATKNIPGEHWKIGPVCSRNYVTALYPLTIEQQQMARRSVWKTGDFLGCSIKVTTDKDGNEWTNIPDTPIESIPPAHRGYTDENGYHCFLT